MENKYKNFYTILTAVSGFIIIVIFFLMLFREVISPEWKQNQNDFTEHTEPDRQDNSIPASSSGLKQIEIHEFNHIDRCITCHLNIENEDNQNLNPPFSGHPGQDLEHHDLASFGCTLCHSGTGRSLLRDETCNPDRIVDWRPVDSNCAKCHLSIFSTPANPVLPHSLNRAKQDIYQLGCLGCHKIRHVGGQFGPDLSNQADKIRQGYNFKNVQGKHSIFNWHLEHFENPPKISPGSIMPDFDMDPEQIESLTTMVLGLSNPVLPFRYYDMAVLSEFKNQRPRVKHDNLFSLVCSACHGTEGQGRSFKDNIFGVPALANIDFQSIASTEMIEFIIQEGRSNKYMQSWKSRHSGLIKEELSELLRFVGNFRAEAPSFADVRSAQPGVSLGKALYINHCSNCHNAEKSGGIGPSLNNAAFRALSSDEFLYTTLTRGRANTAMPSWSRFNSKEIHSLIREIQPVKRRISSSQLTEISSEKAAEGQNIYHYHCSRCHGQEGNGGIGPAILKKDFLDAASDEFIIETIRRGRTHTPMFAALQDKNVISDLLHFMRQRQQLSPEIIAPGPVLGNAESGNLLYQKFCAECHGKSGEGIEAPALNNQEVLNAASNGYFLATITMGRENTPMPKWGKTTENRRALIAKERHDIVAFIRAWQKMTIKRETAGHKAKAIAD